MESQPQNPEFRINPENFHPCISLLEDFFCLSRQCRSRYECHKFCRNLCLQSFFLAQGIRITDLAWDKIYVILPRLWLYWNSPTWSSSDIIVMSK